MILTHYHGNPKPTVYRGDGGGDDGAFGNWSSYTQQLSKLPKSIKSKVAWQKCTWSNYCACDMWGCTDQHNNRQTNRRGKHEAIFSCVLHARPAGKTVRAGERCYEKGFFRGEKIDSKNFTSRLVLRLLCVFHGYVYIFVRPHLSRAQ